MAIETIKYRFAMRRALAATWTSTNDVLLDGEWGYEKDTGKVKIGDGTTGWNALPYFAGGSGGVAGVASIIAGSGIDVDDTDPANPVVSSTTGAIALSGRVATYAALPSTGLASGDAYLVEADELIYVYDGTAFPSDGAGLAVTRSEDEDAYFLFEGTTKGVWYDPSDIATLFQDSAGTTPVTAAGQRVGKMLDKSGFGKHATQSVSGARPIYQVDSNGCAYLEFTGSEWMDCGDAFNSNAVIAAVAYQATNTNGRLMDCRGTGAAVVGWLLKSRNSGQELMQFDDASGVVVRFIDHPTDLSTGSIGTSASPYLCPIGVGPHMVVGRYGAGSGRLSLDGAAEERWAYTALGSIVSTTVSRIGAAANDSTQQRLQGRIYQMVYADKKGTWRDTRRLHSLMSQRMVF